MAVEGRVREGAVLDDEVTAQKLTVITALPNSYRRRLAAVEDEDGRLTLRFDGGPVAAWGDAERTLAKTVALRTVLAGVRGRRQDLHAGRRLHRPTGRGQAGAPLMVEPCLKPWSKPQESASMQASCLTPPRAWVR